MASSGLLRGAIFAASINVVCKCLLRCFDSGVRCTVLPELFSAPHNGILDAGAHHGGTISDTKQTVTQEGLDNSAARLLPPGTVCLSRTASVGYVVIMERSMATSQDFVNWVCSEALLPEFLMYALMAEGDDIRRFGRGTTHTTIYFPEVKALHICLPPLEEQREIVSRIKDQLRLADDIERHVLAATPRAAKLTQAILAKAFRGELVPTEAELAIREGRPCESATGASRP
jgi:type I restriction enzyme, S subunit